MNLNMEIPVEFRGSKDHHSYIVKGKRTKRQRPSSPFGLAVTSSSSSGSGVGGGGGGGGDFYSLFPSPTTSCEIADSTDEDEDMANCLILLAQGGCPRQVEEEEEEAKIEKLSSRRFTEMAATTTTCKAGFYVYECKTCNRTFPSFQALGGHRASHKKLKAIAMEEKSKTAALPLNYDVSYHGEGIFNKISSRILHGNNNNKAKVHGCSLCGAEFSSGQALGGHMRRHRTAATGSTQINTSIDTNTSDQSSEQLGDKTRHILPLDLNLPAPEDDHHDSRIQFSANGRHLVFSGPALVDCHY